MIIKALWRLSINFTVVLTFAWVPQLFDEMFISMDPESIKHPSAQLCAAATIALYSWDLGNPPCHMPVNNIYDFLTFDKNP